MTVMYRLGRCTYCNNGYVSISIHKKDNLKSDFISFCDFGDNLNDYVDAWHEFLYWQKPLSKIYI